MKDSFPWLSKLRWTLSVMYFDQGRSELTPAIYSHFTHMMKGLAGGKVCIIFEVRMNFSAYSDTFNTIQYNATIFHIILVCENWCNLDEIFLNYLEEFYIEYLLEEEEQSLS